MRGWGVWEHQNQLFSAAPCSIDVRQHGHRMAAGWKRWSRLEERPYKSASLHHWVNLLSKCFIRNEAIQTIYDLGEVVETFRVLHGGVCGWQIEWTQHVVKSQLKGGVVWWHHIRTHIMWIQCEESQVRCIGLTIASSHLAVDGQDNSGYFRGGSSAKARLKAATGGIRGRCSWEIWRTAETSHIVQEIEQCNGTSVNG